LVYISVLKRKTKRILSWRNLWPGSSRPLLRPPSSRLYRGRNRKKERMDRSITVTVMCTYLATKVFLLEDFSIKGLGIKWSERF
jgi:hypothetical protein